MMTQAIRKRRRECSTAVFVSFVFCCAALITLPGFLFFYFWEGAGFGISTLIGFLIGSFALSILDVIGSAVATIFGNPAKSKSQQAKPNQRIQDA
jgi:hypothetical protein